MTDIVTRPYTVSVTRFVRVASEQWIRRMWPIYALYIVVGIAALVLARDPVWVFVGIASLLWPITVPLRMLRAHLMKPEKGQEMQVAVDEERVRFLKARKGKDAVSLSKLIRVRKMAGCYLFYTTHHHYFFVPIDAFASEDRPMLEAHLQAKGLLP